jgi:hypothetical protein
MIEPIEQGFMVFLAEGKEGIGGVRGVSKDSLVVFVENAGEFIVPLTAVKTVHDHKVLLNPRHLDKALLDAVGHVHDSEDPRLVG